MLDEKKKPKFQTWDACVECGYVFGRPLETDICSKCDEDLHAKFDIEIPRFSKCLTRGCNTRVEHNDHCKPCLTKRAGQERDSLYDDTGISWREFYEKIDAWHPETLSYKKP